MGIDLLKCIKI